MKILLLSFYFRPDLSAGSFRANALTEALKACLPPGSTVDVLTTSPNRYQSFSASAEVEESDGQIRIRRIDLPLPRKGVGGQVLAFLSYARAVMRIVGRDKYDVVYATSSRLMTASLGAWIARRIGAPLYLDIRDLFVDTIGDILPKKMAFLAKPVFSLVERWTFSRASRVNLVSEGFKDYVARRHPGLRLSFFTNGVDDEFLGFAQSQGSGSEVTKNTTTRIVYAGNIGEGQGLENILPDLVVQLPDKANFLVIGDGGRKSVLTAAVAQSSKVKLVPPVKRAQLIEEYRAADVLFLHLNDHPAFRKVLPSKLFEYAATGKPILAGLSGYSADFVRREIINAAVFAPCDANGALEALASLSLETVNRDDFIKKFSRETIMLAMARDVIGTSDDQD